MDTIHVGSDRSYFSSLREENGAVTYGLPVPHEAANIRCSQVLGTYRDGESGVKYDIRCKKRGGHITPRGEDAHVPVDMRIVAAPRRVVHPYRFKPNRIPASVDMDITLPHDCRNHLG